MNSVALLGALTKDPEPIRGGKEPICRLRLIELNGHPEQPLYINVSVFGAQARACAEHLAKGRQVAICGRLRFREWQGVDRSRRSEYSIAAERVDFLSTRGAAEPAPEPTGSG